MKWFLVRVYTDPVGVAEAAEKVNLTAGTSHVYGKVLADDDGQARGIVIDRFQRAGLWKPRYNDVQVEETR